MDGGVADTTRARCSTRRARARALNMLGNSCLSFLTVDHNDAKLMNKST